MSTGRASVYVRRALLMWRLWPLVALVATACIFESAPPSPTPSPTAARPKFEITTYMYALQVKGKIRVGVLDREPPFATTDAGKRAGFEPDLARELAKAIFGAQRDPDGVVEWISLDRSTSISALTSGQADVVLARAPVRADTPVDFSEAYFVTGERVLVTKANDEIKDVSDLDTKTVCVTTEASAAHVDDASPSAKTLQLDTYASCLGALKAGQVDAIAADEAVLWGLMKQDADTKIVGKNVTTERYAIGMKKSESGDRNGLLPFVNAWLGGAIRDGTWGRLYAQDVAPLSGERKTAP